MTAAKNPTVPSTMLIRKIGRHVSPAMSASMMNPATMGPRTAEMPITGPKALTARGICAREKVAVRMLMPCGIRRAPKPPCTSLAPINMVGVTESPHTIDAPTKPTMPIRKVRRLP